MWLSGFLLFFQGVQKADRRYARQVETIGFYLQIVGRTIMKLIKIRKSCLLILCLLVMAGCAGQNTNSTKILDLRVNNLINPLGIDSVPYFSWKMQDDTVGKRQTAYQIFVSKTKQGLIDKEYVWDSGKVENDISVAIEYTGDTLEEDTEYFWQVEVWDEAGHKNSSEVSSFAVGKLFSKWENAEWISFEKETNTQGKYLATEYMISYQFRMENAATGFIWGADEGRYGTYYLGKFYISNDQVIFELLQMHNEVEISSQKVELDTVEVEEFIASEHQVQIAVKDDDVCTNLDGMEIARFTVDEKIPIAAIGLFVERGSLKAWYDEISVTNAANEVLYQDSFENEEEHIFSPYYLKVEDGWARADSGYIVVPGYEVPAPMFRKQFSTENKSVVSAKIYATALGIYDIYVNGKDICEEFASPGQSYYYDEVYYRTYDITSAIADGKNAIGIMLGHGRYDRSKEAWGEDLAVCAQIVIQYEDGTKQIVGTDDTWLVYTDGPIRSDDIYNGEYYDANYEVADWSKTACDETGWKNAITYSAGEALTKKSAIDNGVVIMDTIQSVDR